MNGLELSKLYFQDVIRPMLLEQFPNDFERIAAGLVGEGSECFGYDDEISRDHDWGAKVCLWLDSAEYQENGEILQRKLMHLPNTYQGYPVCWIPNRNGVLEISGFFRKYLDTDGPLQTVGQWLHVPEHHLAVASNGEIFHDPVGKFSTIWNDLRLGYPEDIRLKKISAYCMLAAQSGQYNYPRLMRRNDTIAMSLALNEFIRAVISIVYLLNNKYVPFYKWMFYGMKRLSLLGTEMSMKLERLACAPKKEALIEDICELLITEFVRQKITDYSDRYMAAQGESIHAHIQNVGLRQTNPWVAS